VLAVEGRDTVSGPGFCGVSRRVEPQTQVVKLDRVCRGIVVRIRERLWVVEVNDRSRSDARRNDESLDTEATDEAAEALSCEACGVCQWLNGVGRFIVAE